MLFAYVLHHWKTYFVFFLCLSVFICGQFAFANPPVASYIFPAGGQRGTTVKVRVGGLYLYKSCPFELLGVGVDASKQLHPMPTLWFEGPVLPLPASQQKEDYPRDMAGEIRIAADAVPGARRGRLWTAEGAAGGLRFVVGELPEIVEQEIDGDPIPVDVKLPVTINGRIFPREDVDDWTFHARKGQVITAAVCASPLGSPLDSLLEVFDPHGRKIAENDDADTNDSRLRFTAVEEGKYRLRIRDVNQQGGPAYVYRLTIGARSVSEGRASLAYAAGSDRNAFQLRLTADALTLPRGGQGRLYIVAERSGGFKGPIALRVAGLPPGVAASKTTIKAGQTATDITLTTTAFAAMGTNRLTIHGSASHDGRIITRTATLPAERSELTVDNVLLAVALKPPFKIVGDYDLRLAPRGSVFRRRYRIERNGFTGPLEVSLADRQARHLQGVSGPTLTIPPETDVFEYPVRLPPWMETGRTSRACIMAVGVIQDGENEYTVGYSSEAQNEQIIAVVETGRLGVEVDRPSLAAVPDGKAELTVRVRRGKGLAGPVKIELVQPKHMHGVEAETVVVAKDRSVAVFRMHFASDKLGPFNMPLVLRATLDHPDGPAIAETKLELVPQ
ncbi:MAG TPA: PPC domain-containing protein [Gemmataceae bacterium]|nr:PPC domain-containing protein [Gemmataceae bacterium]